MVMAQRSRTMHRENRTPWQDVTSTWDTWTHSQFCGGTRGELAPAWPRPHLALEAEDGDRKTHQSRDPQAQKHRFGVVEAERRGSLLALLSGTPIFGRGYVTVWPYLDTNPIMKAMLRVWTREAERIWAAASLFTLLSRRDTYKEDQQDNIPWKLPPVWMKLTNITLIFLKKTHKGALCNC